jgi:hypothetical protein
VLSTSALLLSSQDSLEGVDATVDEQLHSRNEAGIVRSDKYSCLADVTAFPNATTRHHFDRIFADFFYAAKR